MGGKYSSNQFGGESPKMKSFCKGGIPSYQMGGIHSIAPKISPMKSIPGTVSPINPPTAPMRRGLPTNPMQRAVSGNIAARRAAGVIR